MLHIALAGEHRDASQDLSRYAGIEVSRSNLQALSLRRELGAGVATAR